MKKLLFLFFLVALSANAQPKKYQSLLWEISGNGLSKKSYLYGSMHVSDKISYHLSDAFFKHLLASDYVATESDPSTWIKLYDVLSSNQFANANQPFYSRFYQKPARREDLYPLFVNDNNIINNLLSRTTENQKDFQEDTYLDMFIYQTGRKYKKKVIGLENAKTSMISVLNSEAAAEEPLDENSQAIVKVLKERSFNQAMLDFYREKNLDMLDSLYVLMTPPSYHKALITDRNNVMLKSIDSIARKGSLFAAVGAAHLPGKKGLIEMLREKGYTVKPVVDAYTNNGQKTKKTIDAYFSKPQFHPMRTPDGMISAPMLQGPIYNRNDIGTPDLSNGAMVNLKRVSLRNYLKKNSDFNPATLDSLFYENIPGNILQKRTFIDDNATVFDITSRTKTGNAQRYRYYVTPLEIICVSMNGNGSYVRMYENEVFPNIKLKKYNTAWETVMPEKGGFSVTLPSYYTMYGNRASATPENIELQAFDASENAYYFLSERSVNDNQTLEETAFELKRIQDEFYAQLDIIPTSGSDVAFDTSYESKGTAAGRNYTLKTIVRGQKYYLLGTVDASQDNIKRYFQSFAFSDFRKDQVAENYVDSVGHFSIALPKNENERLFWKIKDQNARLAQGRKNVFKTNDKQYSLFSASGKMADLFAWTYHRYDFVHNLDTLKASIRRNILEDYNKFTTEDDAAALQAFQIEQSHEGYETSGNLPSSSWNRHLSASQKKRHSQRLAVISDVSEQIDDDRKLLRMNLTVTRPESAQAIKYIAYFQDGYIWYLRSLVDKNQKQDDFLDALADSFSPITQPPAYSLFRKKTAVFLEDAKSENDSIRYSAFESSDMLQIDKSDLPQLKEFLTSFEFRPEETAAVGSILERIGKIDAPEMVPFLESCYKKEGVNAMLQLAIIRALTKQKSEFAYKKIADLLEYDLPLSDNESEISSLFLSFAEDTDHSKLLYPSIFQYYSVSEYHDPIARFVTQLIRENKANPKKLKPYRKMLLADARLEAKRVQVWKAKKDADEADFDYPSPVENLKNYANMLYGFKNDKSIALWFEKLGKLDLREVDFEIVSLDLANKSKRDDRKIAALIANPATSFATYRLLHDEKHEVPEWSDEQIAKALVLSYTNTDEGSKTELLSKRRIAIGDKEAVVFFFKNTSSLKNAGFSATTKLEAVAFLSDKDGIDPKSWKLLPSTPVFDVSDIEAACEIAIDRLLNSDRPRVTFGKLKDSQYDPEYEF
ncbi:TraB/GumN family protein [Flavobacterium selenitireducens]|uniref:TraB/GumN family protein n=1 Tax=Flavobacterium selenitireducens TaxID=2722704 RepID=UPI00168BED25|nr:TraB/GumN family protein [Flavobacterium selenitireducens]MBD3582337.1 TraB/GumN family protein [Flavobacterium selenitireducens]